jgi:hypothetical protein
MKDLVGKDIAKYCLMHACLGQMAMGGAGLPIEQFLAPFPVSIWDVVWRELFRLPLRIKCSGASFPLPTGSPAADTQPPPTPLL